MNINQYEKNELAKLAAAFGPSMITIGATGLTGTVADVLIAALGSLSTTYAIIGRKR